MAKIDLGANKNLGARVADQLRRADKGGEYQPVRYKVDYGIGETREVVHYLKKDVASLLKTAKSYIKSRAPDGEISPNEEREALATLKGDERTIFEAVLSCYASVETAQQRVQVLLAESERTAVSPADIAKQILKGEKYFGINTAVLKDSVWSPVKTATAPVSRGGSQSRTTVQKTERDRVKFNVETDPTDAANELRQALKKSFPNDSFGFRFSVVGYEATRVQGPRWSAGTRAPSIRVTVSTVEGGVDPRAKAAITNLRKAYPGLEVRVDLEESDGRLLVNDDDGFPRFAKKGEGWKLPGR